VCISNGVMVMKGAQASTYGLQKRYANDIHLHASTYDTPAFNRADNRTMTQPKLSAALPSPLISKLDQRQHRTHTSVTYLEHVQAKNQKPTLSVQTKAYYVLIHSPHSLVRRALGLLDRGLRRARTRTCSLYGAAQKNREVVRRLVDVGLSSMPALNCYVGSVQDCSLSMCPRRG